VPNFVRSLRDVIRHSHLFFLSILPSLGFRIPNSWQRHVHVPPEDLTAPKFLISILMNL
jgi:hypothetical protein